MTTRTLAFLLALVPSLALAGPRVVTTTEGLAALVREVSAGRASVESLSRGSQDPHYVDANPMLAVKLRNADLLVDVGLDLEIGWLPPLVNQSRNAAIQPGGARRLTAASAVQVLDVPTGPVDRSRGDLHPAGNPHFLTDPRRALQVATAIAAKLGELDHAGAAAYQGALAAFRTKLEADMARWQATLAPVKGKKIFSQHRTLTYFLDWSGIVSAGEIEPRPGVPAPPAYLAELVQRAQREQVKAIVVENYYDTKSAEVVARHAGAKVVRVPGDVGGEPGVKSYEQWIEALVGRVAGALR
ncbi:metal ABC transporter substrate-binding protein [Anaeromyxobacter dehalogenans]|uniref:ABC metal ion transporter, periplasmic solute binding protein n=1 Tax=Anaeromyxobacter dehalogenans (strain 2CP-C) TaxID=290397 RepID=Q2IKD1_ANADE|nr:metal ABC transporter substrate-binding protein [Anaeromyxobacter dehalogenans]ABC82109.1 ABC metal ion transporter, periplasmic solute binding protein [Anaeromyxobacter dehalogenans 2CP-C]